MTHTRSRRTRLSAFAALIAAASLALTACSSDDDTSSDSDSDSSQESGAESWPRTFTNADDTTTEIAEKPEKILSTSVSITGTLVAMDAPVVASAAAGNGKFFAQWAEVAEEQGVETLWAASEVDLESIYAYEPDLIIVSSSGADSLADQISTLQEIAPTILVDYGGQTWQDMAVQLGDGLGLEEEADAAISEFDDYVKDAADKITVPEGQANIISYNGPGETNQIARVGGPHAEILAELGFDVEDPPAEWHTTGDIRNDFVWAAYENLVNLTADTTFILSQDDEGAQEFANDATLANVPSVSAGQVYGLGKNSFRIDKCSATEIVDAVVADFAK